MCSVHIFLLPKENLVLFTINYWKFILLTMYSILEWHPLFINLRISLITPTGVFHNTIIPASRIHSYYTRYASRENLYKDQCPEPIMRFQDLRQRLLEFRKMYHIMWKLYLFLYLSSSISTTSLTVKQNYIPFFPNYHYYFVNLM